MLDAKSYGKSKQNRLLSWHVMTQEEGFWGVCFVDGVEVGIQGGFLPCSDVRILGRRNIPLTLLRAFNAFTTNFTHYRYTVKV